MRFNLLQLANDIETPGQAIPILIYYSISPRVIQCGRHARKLLANQGGSSPDSVLTAQDVLQLLRNTIAMEKSLNLQRLYLRPAPPDAYDDFEGYRYPPYLTKPKRSTRYIRTIYQLWGLAVLKLTARKRQMEALKLKDIYQSWIYTFTYKKLKTKPYHTCKPTSDLIQSSRRNYALFRCQLLSEYTMILSPIFIHLMMGIWGGSRSGICIPTGPRT